MPQRFLRPGIRHSERWNAVSFSAQSLFIRILTLVDDYGRYDGREAVLWGECFAVWNQLHPDESVTLAETSKLLQQLAATFLLEIYDVQEKKNPTKRVLQVLQWEERIREGTREKWPKNPNPQQPAATRSKLLPSPPSPPPSPPPAPAPSVGSFAEIPSWEEFWEYCQSPHCGIAAEWYAKDKYWAACQDQWKGKSNWRAYATRVREWWNNDGRPMAPPVKGRAGKPQLKPDHKKGF